MLKSTVQKFIYFCWIVCCSDDWFLMIFDCWLLTVDCWLLSVLSCRNFCFVCLFYRCQRKKPLICYDKTKIFFQLTCFLCSWSDVAFDCWFVEINCSKNYLLLLDCLLFWWLIFNDFWLLTVDCWLLTAVCFKLSKSRVVFLLSVLSCLMFSFVFFKK